jgi:hypothetical protein
MLAYVEEMARSGGQLSLVQNSAACGGALYKRAGQARDDRVGEPFVSHALADVRNMISELFCEIVHALNRCIRVETEGFGKLAPVVGPDVAQTVFVADLHGQLDTVDIDVAVKKHARNIVKRRETNAGSGLR